MEKQNLIKDKSFNFSLEIIKLYKLLILQKEFIISKQLLRSGTSIGANIEEAIGAQSTKDFISKISIAYKESLETKYWLRLISKSMKNQESEILVKENHDICRILAKILITSKNKLSHS